MSYYIIGTAGHVDHGKTQLIKALTGVDTDRLKEEKERGISIELGFASLTLPSGSRAGVVDVPGHEKFVRQMLAGIGGIDLVLLVIAADEGVMPQTKEHLEIIDLLQVQRGLVVLNKIDLVEPDWCDLVKLEIEEVLQGTVLEGAKIVETSAVTGEGLSSLKELIDSELSKLPPREAHGQCRMPIDRVFSVSGFGTIVTGTLYRGSVRQGDPVVVEPGGLHSRVRSLQVHGTKTDQAFAGQRVAINLPDVEVGEIHRGAILLTPGQLKPVQILDISLRYLPSASRPLFYRQRVRFHIGTKEVLGRIHLLDREEMEPGSTAYAQILLEEPVIGARGDKFVIRHYSPARTIGGGTVLDGVERKYKRYLASVMEQLAIKERGTPEEILASRLLTASQPLGIEDLAKLSGLSEAEVLLGLKGCNAVALNSEGKNYWFSREAGKRWTEGIEKVLADFHLRYPLRPGMPKEEFKSRFFPVLNNKLFQGFLSFLNQEEELDASGNFVAAKGFTPRPVGALQQKSDALLKQYIDLALAPPDWNAASEACRLEQVEAEELLQYFLRRGNLVKIAPNLYFSAQAVAVAEAKINRLLSEKGEFSPAEAKDVLGVSRKFLIPLLEYFDTKKLTRRVQDKRVKF